MKNIAVQGCSIELSPPSTSPLTVITVTTQPNNNMKCDGKGVYTGQISVSISAYGSETITDMNGAGPATIVSTAQYVKVDGQPVLLEGDEDNNCAISGTTGGQTAVTDIITVKISAAGQTSVAGE